MDLITAARLAYDEVDTFLDSLTRAERSRDVKIQDSFVRTAPRKDVDDLFGGQLWNDLVYACELERSDLGKLRVSSADHERAAEVFEDQCLQERQVEYDRRFARTLVEVSEDVWEEKGDLFEAEFYPDRHRHDLQAPLVHLSHAGFVRKRGDSAGKL